MFYLCDLRPAAVAALLVETLVCCKTCTDKGCSGGDESETV